MKTSSEQHSAAASSIVQKEEVGLCKAIQRRYEGAENMKREYTLWPLLFPSSHFLLNARRKLYTFTRLLGHLMILSPVAATTILSPSANVP
jgi:hypothetical protein